MLRIIQMLHRSVLLRNTTRLLRYLNTITKIGTFNETIKKSKFKVTVIPAATADEAQRVIEASKDKTATHNCWAYKVGSNICRFNDDGEPSGTAGKPILSAIEFEDVTNVAVVVTRYYGGVKLGAGGLIRAYRSTARKCIQSVLQS